MKKNVKGQMQGYLLYALLLLLFSAVAEDPYKTDGLYLWFFWFSFVLLLCNFFILENPDPTLLLHRFGSRRRLFFYGLMHNFCRGIYFSTGIVAITAGFFLLFNYDHRWGASLHAWIYLFLFYQLLSLAAIIDAIRRRRFILTTAVSIYLVVSFLSIQSFEIVPIVAGLNPTSGYVLGQTANPGTYGTIAAHLIFFTWYAVHSFDKMRRSAL